MRVEVLMSTTRIDEAKLVEAIKKELLGRVSSGALPNTVGSFSELHDYMDANELGGMTQGDVLAQLEEEHGPADAPNQGWIAVVNRVQGEVDSWIRGGGFRNLVEPEKVLQPSSQPQSRMGVILNDDLECLSRQIKRLIAKSERDYRKSGASGDPECDFEQQGFIAGLRECRKMIRSMRAKAKMTSSVGGSS